eukprot:7513340-Pyramimonas_sp.AAC.1
MPSPRVDSREFSLTIGRFSTVVTGSARDIDSPIAVLFGLSIVRCVHRDTCITKRTQARLFVLDSQRSSAA